MALMIRNKVHSITVTGDSAQGRTLSEDTGQGELAKHRPCTPALLLTQTGSSTQGGKRKEFKHGGQTSSESNRKEGSPESEYCLPFI